MKPVLTLILLVLLAGCAASTPILQCDQCTGLKYYGQKLGPFQALERDGAEVLLDTDAVEESQ